MKIKDIAKLANVSQSAVSLALNGKPGISEATREKILKITKEHGYTAKNLVKTNEKVFRFVACTNQGIVSEKYETLPFFMELLHTIDQSIRSKGHSFIISSINVNSLLSEIDALETEQPSDGMILLGTNLTAEQIRSIAAKQTNLVVIDTCFETVNVDFIVMNNVLGAFDAAEYLLRRGHSKIGYVESNIRFYNFDMRRHGFELALKEKDLFLDKKFIYTLPPTDISVDENLKQKLIQNIDQLPTALFCECDYMAISIIKTLNEIGINVPQDVSVIGFDNIWESQIIHPELTTIDVRKDKIAELAVEKLIQNLDEDNERIKMFVDTELVERKSCIEVS